MFSFDVGCVTFIEVSLSMTEASVIVVAGKLIAFVLIKKLCLLKHQNIFCRHRIDFHSGIFFFLLFLYSILKIRIVFFSVLFSFRIMYSTSDIRSSCRIVPGLSREQLDLCYKANDVTIAALDGLDLAMRECQLQVSKCINCHTPRVLNNFLFKFKYLVSVASLELFIA